ncbi:hypothetical protein [uncultured Sphingomonas sp.]|uniref:hypothetical protein n=1 Tax=uncultured Sphingomonas sp. TaxID=158754 RepID=UPI0025DE4BED|nr:hypothetical protein [uncultured Sphingomonas sp.]
MLGFIRNGRRALAGLLTRGAEIVQPASEIASTEEDPPTIGPDTLKYMGDLASDSFKRQLDLDESVWRSLPFFAATFAFVAAVVGRAATDTPALTLSGVSVTAHVFLVLAVISLGWALRWFVPMLRKREYEFPSDDEAVKQYAAEMNAYHAALGLEGEDLDAKVLEELRLFMIDQHGSAARFNFKLNGIRMAARSQALRFMLIGFVLAFLCEATIFVHRDLFGPVEVQNGAEQRQGDPQGQRVGTVHTGSTDAPEIAAGDGRRELLGSKVQAAEGTGEAGVSKPPSKPPTGSVQAPTRPTRPAPQYMAKRATEVANSYGRGRQQPAVTERPVPPEKKDR